jgi:hypothetical protein
MECGLMLKISKYAGQALFYAAFVAAIGAFSSWPLYNQVPESSAQIKLSFTHGGARVEDCYRPTAKDLSEPPSASRRLVKCSRERQPVVIRLVIDGTEVYAAALKPGGYSGDGQAQTYEKFIVPVGKHVIIAQLRDSKRSEGFDYESKFEAELAPWQNLAIDFKAGQGGFLFR